jgi:hypothetical protein
MLLYKNWLETWPRLLLFTGFLLLFSTLTVHGTKNNPNAAQQLPVYFGFLFVMFYPVILAGSGISTQQSFRPSRGLHGSTLFTLSLPVTRFRLLAVRSALGIAEICLGVAAVFGVMWTAFPFVRAQWSILNSVEFVVADSLCLTGFYFMCVVIAAIVEDVQFQVFAGIVLMFLLRYISVTAPIPPSVNVIRAMGAGSPLITHAIPWASIGISLGASVIFFLIALKIVQSHEY